MQSNYFSLNHELILDFLAFNFQVNNSHFIYFKSFLTLQIILNYLPDLFLIKLFALI